MQAAVEGKTVEFVRQLQTSTGEAKTFQAVLQTLGFSLPDYAHMAMVLPTSSLVVTEPTSASSQALWSFPDPHGFRLPIGESGFAFAPVRGREAGGRCRVHSHL